MQKERKVGKLKISSILIVIFHTYLIIVFTWVILNGVFGDRWGWLFLLNSFAVYLFILFPIPLVAAIITQRRSLMIGSIGVFIVAIYFYGNLFLPSYTQTLKTDSQLTVMTFNILGYNTQPEGVLTSITESDAGIIALQELNPEIAAAIQEKLIDEYPYQTLDPKIGTQGMGVISRHPLRENPTTLTGIWVGEPLILEVNWEDTDIILVNFHAIPPGSVIHSKRLNFTTQERNRQIGELISFVNKLKEPVIVLGDLNVTEKNDAYKIAEASLMDAWSEKGWGFGHTFPGAASTGSSRPAILGIPLAPKWLVRLDYVFCSNEWQVESASFGQWDGVSDHRPVKAILGLVN